MGISAVMPYAAERAIYPEKAKRDKKSFGNQSFEMAVNGRMESEDDKTSSVPARSRGMTVTSSSGLTLHYEKERADGSTCKFSWVDAQTGVNTCVYKPADFSEENPILRVEIWDKDGNLTEKDVNPLEVNPSNATGGEMAAYSVYLKETGQCQNTDISFLWTKSNLDSTGETYDGVSRLNWEKLGREWLKMQFGAGNMKGYYDYLPYYQLLKQQCALFGGSSFTEKGDDKQLGRFYSAEEMQKMQEDLMARNLAKKPKLSATEIYRQNHPEYNGEAIFRFGNSAKLYTAEEIEKLRMANIVYQP
ncbi:hypothetical protein [Butyrivibrio sp. INlla14]|uniref:hypothetical protein n=1 Tax=Butyrivibrio sp. INlla14 TaxID=1520808 RepID=UPI000876F28A|nr:hypothetical protein [Butyrivibrio sp. INlla14]SCY11378.1 hypothetical protein SAMN02910371_01114 [Butyrivibrio sp. INlla14]